MLRYVEIYQYRGEWIMLIVNPDTNEVEWCACNYRIFDDLCDDLEEIRRMMTLDELHSFKPTLKQDTDTLSGNKELRMNADTIRRALWHKQNKYLHEISELFFEEPCGQDISIIGGDIMMNIEIYECDGDYIVMVVDGYEGEILWCWCGYTSYYQVMTDVQHLMTMIHINELDVYVSCMPRTFEQIDKMFMLHKDKRHIRERLRMSGKLLSKQETSIDMKGEY